MTNELTIQVSSSRLAAVLHAVASGIAYFPGYNLGDFDVNFDPHSIIVSYDIASIDNKPVERSIEVVIPHAAVYRASGAFPVQVAELVRWSTQNDNPSKAESLADMFLDAHARHNTYAYGIGAVVGCNDCEVEYEVAHPTGELLRIGDLGEPAITSPIDHRVNWGIPQGIYTSVTQFSVCTHLHWRWTVFDPYGRPITSGQTPDEKAGDLRDEIDTAVWWAVYMKIPF